MLIVIATYCKHVQLSLTYTLVAECLNLTAVLLSQCLVLQITDQLSPSSPTPFSSPNALTSWLWEMGDWK